LTVGDIKAFIRRIVSCFKRFEKQMARVQIQGRACVEEVLESTIVHGIFSGDHLLCSTLK